MRKGYTFSESARLQQLAAVMATRARAQLLGAVKIERARTLALGRG